MKMSSFWKRRVWPVTNIWSFDVPLLLAWNVDVSVHYSDVIMGTLACQINRVLRKGSNKGKKFWIILFTCGVIRAIHLELVPALSTGAIRRFVARRGLPRVLYSDNAKGFVASPPPPPPPPSCRYILVFSPPSGGLLFHFPIGGEAGGSVSSVPWRGPWRRL